LKARTTARRRGALIAVPAALFAMAATAAVAQEATPAPATIGVLDRRRRLPSARCRSSARPRRSRGPRSTQIVRRSRPPATGWRRSWRPSASPRRSARPGRWPARSCSARTPAGALLPLRHRPPDPPERQRRRDNYLYQNTLQTEAFPLATFVLRGVEGLDGPLRRARRRPSRCSRPDAEGPDRLVAWEATATLEGDRLTGTAATEFEMPEFAIERRRADRRLARRDGAPRDRPRGAGERVAERG
jgi:hypothetical protein